MSQTSFPPGRPQVKRRPRPPRRRKTFPQGRARSACTSRLHAIRVAYMSNKNRSRRRGRLWTLKALKRFYLWLEASLDHACSGGIAASARTRPGRTHTTTGQAHHTVRLALLSVKSYRPKAALSQMTVESRLGHVPE